MRVNQTLNLSSRSHVHLTGTAFGDSSKNGYIYLSRMQLLKILNNILVVALVVPLIVTVHFHTPVACHDVCLVRGDHAPHSATKHDPLHCGICSRLQSFNAFFGTHISSPVLSPVVDESLRDDITPYYSLLSSPLQGRAPPTILD